MAYLISCPSCSQEGINPKYNPSACSFCHTQFQIKAICPKCVNELERIQACGAVDFFCNHCNEMISKRQANYLFEKQ